MKNCTMVQITHLIKQSDPPYYKLLVQNTICVAHAAEFLQCFCLCVCVRERERLRGKKRELL